MPTTESEIGIAHERTWRIDEARPAYLLADARYFGAEGHAFDTGGVTLKAGMRMTQARHLVSLGFRITQDWQAGDWTDGRAGPVASWSRLTEEGGRLSVKANIAAAEHQTVPDASGALGVSWSQSLPDASSWTTGLALEARLTEQSDYGYIVGAFDRDRAGRGVEVPDGVDDGCLLRIRKMEGVMQASGGPVEKGADDG